MMLSKIDAWRIKHVAENYADACLQHGRALGNSNWGSINACWHESESWKKEFYRLVDSLTEGT